MHWLDENVALAAWLALPLMVILAVLPLLLKKSQNLIDHGFKKNRNWLEHGFKKNQHGVDQEVDLSTLALLKKSS